LLSRGLRRRGHSRWSTRRDQQQRNDEQTQHGKHLAGVHGFLLSGNKESMPHRYHHSTDRPWWISDFPALACAIIDALIIMTPFTASMFHIFRRFASLSIFALLVCLTACTSAPASPTLVAPTPTATLQPQPLPPTAVPDTTITLTLWLPTRFLPARDNAAYQVLQGQLNEFARTADGTPSQIVIKQDHGPGGLLDLLRAASPVAPSALPDVIALDNTDLETAARSGLLQPIGPLLPAELVNDLYPFARDLGSSGGELYGVVYSADLEHLATGSALPLPQDWPGLLNEPRRYLFALGNGDTGVSDAVLAHYYAAGGTLVDAQGNPALDETALRTLLETYQAAQDKGILAGNFIDLDSADKVWSAWRGFGAAVANLNATRYLSVETRLPDLQVGSLPALSQPARSLGRGWTYAVVTKDPRRQAAAARLIQQLLSPPNNGDWTRSAHVLPGRAAALARWDQTDPYTNFAGTQLAQAQAAPPASLLNVIGPALRTAIVDVLTDRATPAEAARAAVRAVSPEKK
jgi:ABC-type glycerol-3-phosphate transport system substrate-binding protein